MLTSTTLWMITAGSVVHGMAVRPRQLSAAATATGSSATPSLSSGSSSVSKDSGLLKSNTSSYYLGYRAEDFAKPYAKYWNPTVAPPTQEVIGGLTSSPKAEGLIFSPQEASDYLTRPGYLSIENGYSTDKNGTVFIAARTDIPEVTGDALDWWFGWYPLEPARYKLWNPAAHRYSYRAEVTEDWANVTLRDRYIGTTQYFDEYPGNDAGHLSALFINPKSIGFDPSAWPSQGIETVIAARMKVGVYTTTDFDDLSYMIHQVRRKPDGNRELRSRFWLAKENGGTQQLGHDLAAHAHMEMNHLGKFLPALYQEFKGSI